MRAAEGETVSTGLIIAIAICLLSFAGGVACVVRYARTRRVALLVAGLLLMLVLPAVILLGALGVFKPPSMGCYAPPEDFAP